MIQSRFTSSEAVTFEFQKTEKLPNYPTLFVSHVAINFDTAPATAGNVQLYIEDDEGKDLLWEAEAMSKTHLSFSPSLHVPVTNGAKLKVEYANANSVETSVRILWKV